MNNTTNRLQPNKSSCPTRVSRCANVRSSLTFALNTSSIYLKLRVTCKVGLVWSLLYCLIKVLYADSRQLNLSHIRLLPYTVLFLGELSFSHKSRLNMFNGREHTLTLSNTVKVDAVLRALHEVSLRRFHLSKRFKPWLSPILVQTSRIKRTMIFAEGVRTFCAAE